MAEESFQEKTEAATPRRREESRRKGQVARSQELNSVVVLMAGISSIYLLGDILYRDLSVLMIKTLESIHTFEMTPTNFQAHLLGWGMTFFGAMGPILLTIGVAALAVSLAQVGFLVSEEALVPKFNRLNPISGAKRIFSKRSLVELAKGILKVLIVGYVSYLTIAPELPRIAILADASLGSAFKFIGFMVFKVGLHVSLALLVLAALDYAYQRWEHNQSIKMTKQQVKEELKQTEGDPQVKMRIRALQREAARKRMMDEIPEADVVVANPTHYAVALRYDMESMNAPKLVAKGQNLIAEKIKEVAKQAGVPIVENKPLAQTLFKAVEIGAEIPDDLYKAVAEVLAYVFRLKGNNSIVN